MADSCSVPGTAQTSDSGARHIQEEEFRADEKTQVLKRLTELEERYSASLAEMVKLAGELKGLREETRAYQRNRNEEQPKVQEEELLAEDKVLVIDEERGLLMEKLSELEVRYTAYNDGVVLLREELNRVREESARFVEESDSDIEYMDFDSSDEESSDWEDAELGCCAGPITNHGRI
ncbi:coiled-coil domain-containing protein 136-like isoform X1 [Aplysia californica]|uniref:Coiled-coil domain-containing protein 136-like isoform X1 n=1 Tax=Aplysia californica TaxID=6500 RepID=A0ABM0ZX94_APLCA|nr:coiled-coil domain-containing protein 136-like isoform X1 [Aplysia californica]